MRWSERKFILVLLKNMLNHNDNFVFAVADRGTTCHQTTALPSKPVGRPREPKHYSNAIIGPHMTPLTCMWHELYRLSKPIGNDER